MNVRLNEAYFQQLLLADNSIEAVSNLSGFWANRLAFDESDFGLSKVEFYVQLSLIYFGEVSNGGHIQFLLNRGTVHVNATILALNDIALNEHANILTDASEVLKGNKQPSEFAPREIESLRDADVRTMSSTTNVDALLLGYIRENEEYVLLPERGIKTNR